MGNVLWQNSNTEHKDGVNLSYVGVGISSFWALHQLPIPYCVRKTTNFFEALTIGIELNAVLIDMCSKGKILGRPDNKISIVVYPKYSSTCD